MSLPEELALGAASGRPSAAISDPAKPRGMRSATLSSPAETSGWIGAPGLSGSTSVSRARPECGSEPRRQRVEPGRPVSHRRVCHMGN